MSVAAAVAAAGASADDDSTDDADWWQTVGIVLIGFCVISVIAIVAVAVIGDVLKQLNSVSPSHYHDEKSDH